MWICTKDHEQEESGGTSRVDHASPNYIKEVFDKYVKYEEVKKWLTKDDDGNKIHEGLFAYHKDDTEFGPLDDLSQPDCGATEIYLWSEEDDDWEVV